MEIIKFSTNWNNKLNCTAFTTFRLHNPSKYIGGNIYDIHLKSGESYKSICIAVIKEIKTLQLYQVDNFISLIDTGYDQIVFISMLMVMYKNKNIDFSTQKWDHILLSKVTPL